MDAIATAIRNNQHLQFTYDGHTRTVEPHAYGIDAKGQYALRAFQVRGGSESGEYVGWKLFHRDQMLSVTLPNSFFQDPRQGYRRGDKAFHTILAQL